MIIDLQRRIAEAGRIRIGRQVPTKGKGTRPAKLDTFRLTSPDQRRIMEAARLFGGTVEHWASPAGPAFEVITQTDTLNVLVPPTDLAFSQHYELWAASGCQRRCDGANEVISQSPCLCDPDARECTIHTRLSVLLADMTGLGLWRLDTQGWNAAHELSGAVDIIRVAAARGELLPATLRLEQRVTKRPEQGTRRFAVPVLDINITPAQLFSGADVGIVGAARALEQATIDTPPEPELIQAAVDITTPEPEPLRRTVAEQFNDQPPPTPRKSVAIKATGVQPRKRTERDTPAEPEPDEMQRAMDVVTKVAGTVAKLTGDAPLSKEQNALLHQMFHDCGVMDHDERRIIASHILKGPIDTTKTPIKSGQAATMIDTMQQWLLDKETPVDGRVRDILNTAALIEAGQEELLFDGDTPHAT